MPQAQVSASAEKKPTTRILIVDDHPLLREGVKAALSNQEDMAVIAEATTGREAIDSFREHRPDITLMDLRLPDMSGIDAIISIRASFPGARIIVLTTFGGDVQALRAMTGGASGYLLKSTPRKELLETIRAVHSGRRRIPAEVASEMAEHAGEEVLTRREIEVLQKVASGNANKNIADKLSISEDTVKAHLKNIMAKLRANDRTHAVTIAVLRGFIDI
jgi:DNA-binding NarL/FixJ family response regulator